MMQTVMVATRMNEDGVDQTFNPERISSLAKSMPLVMNGKPGMMKSMEQIYPASCCARYGKQHLGRLQQGWHTRGLLNQQDRRRNAQKQGEMVLCQLAPYKSCRYLHRRRRTTFPQCRRPAER